MRQVRILHLSDIHFGRRHRCAPDDPTHPCEGYRPLFNLIVQDLEECDAFRAPPWRDIDPASPTPLIVAVTGDITETAAPEEFDSAYEMLSSFNDVTLLGTRLTTRDLFVVPGNHDVVFQANKPETRLAPYANFLTVTDFGGPPMKPRESKPPQVSAMASPDFGE